MSRWIGFVDDPIASGSTLEDWDTTPIPVPTLFIPATAAQVDPNTADLNRDNEVRGRRANASPISFADAPQLTVEARAYAKYLRKFVRKALGGSITSTGTVPAAISSTVGPIQTGSLPTMIGWLLREGQLDRVTGLAVNEVAFDFPIDEEGTMNAELWGLYHDVDDPAAAMDPNGSAALALPATTYTGYDDTFMLRDAVAFRGGSLVEIDNLAGFGLTFNNGLIDDFRSRFQPGHNIETFIVDGKQHKLWYPARHKIGPQQVTGRIDLSDVDAALELKRLLRHAEKLVFEVAAGPLGTTPAADEMLRITAYKHAITGGGAEPLQREGDQVASYEFSAYLSEADSNKDVEFTFVGAAALT